MSEAASTADPGIELATPAAATRVYPRPDPIYHGVLLALCTAVVCLAFVLNVRSGSQVLVPFLGTPLPELCTFRRLTGAGCPGCGMTRCFIALAHGELRTAWSYNPAGLLFFALIVFQVPFRSIQLWRIRKGLPELQTGWLGQIVLVLLASAMIGQWLLRLSGVAF